MEQTKFTAEKISRTAEIILNGNIEKVFPLFGAFEERKWAEGWDPVLIFPSKEIIEEGTSFKTQGHENIEEEYFWIITKFDPQEYLIQYLVSAENRYWTITIKCEPSGDNQALSTITYSYYGLNEHGKMLNEHSLNSMFRHNLKDWEEGINNYLGNLNL